MPEVAARWVGRASHPFDDLSRDGALDPRVLCTPLDALLPADRAIVTDGGRFVEHVARRIQPDSPSALLYMQEFGAVGGGMGAAIGAAIGRPERLSTLFYG
jgi:thiamine pyrophosphate-dependent acetolactate synthase large subunit-like protein